MMRKLDTLIARIVLVSVIGITVMHVLSLWTYEYALEDELSAVQEARLAERLADVRRTLSAVSVDDRDRLAHQLSAGPLEIHWSKDRPLISRTDAGGHFAGIATRLRQLAPDLAAADIAVGSAGSVGDPHVSLITLRLPDASWLTASVFAYGIPHTAAHGTLLSTTLMALGVVLVSALVATWMTRPLRSVATAARALQPGHESDRIPVAGPAEVRDLATAFNDLQDRIAHLIEVRTTALAAVSHDLRTPLTRLKLRVEDVGNAELVQAMTADISELEQMIEQTLAYLRGQDLTEAVRAVDLGTVLRSLADDASDLGRKVHLASAPHVVVRGRRLGLKRAFSNLIDNAIKHGTEADISVRAEQGSAIVTIDDDGPGIPDDKLAQVLEPFVRLEPSRSRETGGVGLGLTIAKASIEADGGTIALANRSEGGLRVTVRLPLDS